MQGISEFLAVPFGMVLSGLYSLTGSYLLSIILLTVFVRLLLLPTSISQQKNSAKQVRLNAKVNKIKQKYAGNQQKIQEETQALYQREGFGAANMGCMPLLIQMFVMLGLYGVIYKPISGVLNFTAEKVSSIQEIMKIATDGKNAGRTVELSILRDFGNFENELSAVISKGEFSELVRLKENFTFLGMDLTQQPEWGTFSILWIIPLLACVTALMSSLYMRAKQRKQNPEMAKNPTMGCMTFMSPAMSLVFTFMFPAGVGVYWIISNVVSFVQQVALSNMYSPKRVIAQQMVDETVVRRSRENNVKRRVEMEQK